MGCLNLNVFVSPEGVLHNLAFTCKMDCFNLHVLQLLHENHYKC